MKRIFPILLLIVFLASCGDGAPASPAVTEQAASGESTSTPVLPTSTPIQVENTITSTATSLPPTATSVPPEPDRWYWAVDSSVGKVIAVNQFGDGRAVGDLKQADYLNASYIPFSADRALLFLDTNDNLRVYLLTSDGMQKIALPSEPFYFNTNFSQSSRAIVAVHGDSVVFTYVTRQSTNSTPDAGPILLVDLRSLTAKLIDEIVSQDPYGNHRYWFHSSQDGRYLRYLNGDSGKIEIRELDLVTGDARTISTTRGSLFNIRSSPQGDLWYLRDENIILDLNGNKAEFNGELLAFRSLDDGKGIVFPRDCVDNCEIKVIAPFGNKAELQYSFPWGIESAAYYSDVSQLLPDQSILFAGQPYYYLPTIPAVAQTYPALTDNDVTLFRLTPDGQSRLVGIYKSNVSADGRYVLLKSPDQTSFFIYDTITDRPLFQMPANAGLDYFYSDVNYFDTGMVVNLTASVLGEKNAYRSFFYAYSFETTTVSVWEDVNSEISDCPDLLEDGTVVCWMYRTDTSTTSNFDLVRYDPVSGTRTALMERVLFIASIR